jgi:acyl carrier protein
MMNSKLKAIIAGVYSFDPEETSDADAIEVMQNSDSLKMMTFVATVEDVFCISFSDGEIIDMLDLQSLKHILSNRIPATDQNDE